MVITQSEIKHYELMEALGNKQPFPADYEPCGDCGHDHSYETEHAHKWHSENPCSYCKYDHKNKKHETNCAVIEQPGVFKFRPKHIETAAPTLEENILKLASDLREQGFDIYADTVEEKFLALKTADVHLYRVHDEDAEDLIEFAHPDGDHNVEDGELGDVETIVSQHNKMKAVVKKEPTGKLAEYVQMCRIILADDYLDKLYADAGDTLSKYKNLYVKIMNMMNEDADNNLFFRAIELAIENKQLSSKQVDDETNNMPFVLLNQVEQMKNSTDFSLSGDEEKENWENVQKYFPLLEAQAEKFREIVVNIKAMEGSLKSSSDAIETEKVDPDNATALAPWQLQQSITDLLSRFMALKTKWQGKHPSPDADYQKWFIAQEAEIKNIKTKQNLDEATTNVDAFALQVQ